MDYQILSDNETEKEVEFTIPNEELGPFIEQEVSRLRKKVAIRGYRKGKVPKSLLRTHYQDEIKANALNALITSSYLKFLEEKGLKPASRAELLGLEDGAEIKFRIRIEVLPDFEVKDYLGIEIFKEKPLPLDFLCEQTINDLREKYATIRETDGPSAVDNFVTMDMEIIRDNQILERQSDTTIKIGDRSLPDELNRALIGVKKGERKKIKVDEKVYCITVKKIEEKVLPRVNDDFARLFNCKDTTELKKKVEMIAEENEEARLKEELEESLARILLERNQFMVPKSFIEYEYKLLLKECNLLDSESNKERFWTTAERRARFNLIVEKIAQKENIKTGDEEVMALVNKEYMDVNEKNKEAVIAYLKKMLTKRKVMDFILEHAVISEKSRIISSDEVMYANRSIRH